MDDDDLLMDRVRIKDAGALEDLYDRYGGLVYGIALRIIGDASAAEDAAQAVFLKVWETPSAFSGGNFTAWLGRVTRNYSIDVLRSKQRHPQEQLQRNDVADASGVEDAAFAHLDAKAVHAALSRLSADHRALIELAYFGGFSQQRIAERTGIPIGTVKTRMRRALQHLRGFLDRESEP